MLPNHPLFSDAGVFHDPHKQWSRLASRIRPEHLKVLDASFRLALRTFALLRRTPDPDTPTIPHVAHNVRIGCILAFEWDLREPETLASALLHDVLELCPPERQSDYAADIERTAGVSVAQAVWCLTRPSLPDAVPADTRGRRDAEYFRAIRTGPRWLRLVKCADRLDNLREAHMFREHAMWQQCSTETMGWHLYLARETAPIAEASLFRALVDGERQFSGSVPLWVDGHRLDPAVVRMVPEHVARRYGLVGVAQRGLTLIVGTVGSLSNAQLADIRLAVNGNDHNFQSVEPIEISPGALWDAHSAHYSAQYAPR